jgi:hypothetical protein
MTLKERCQAGEAKLQEVSTALLDPRPETLNRCEAELQDLIGLLEGYAMLEKEPRNSSGLKSDLLGLRHTLRLLALQVQNATNLCQGWAQLSLSQGYTDQGKPALQLSQPQSSYEV